MNFSRQNLLDQNLVEPVAIRGLLKNQEGPDIRFELHRNNGPDFSMIENGKAVGVFWRALTPQEAMRGAGFLPLQDAWAACVSKKYPGYSVVDVEEGFA